MCVPVPEGQAPGDPGSGGGSGGESRSGGASTDTSSSSEPHEAWESRSTPEDVETPAVPRDDSPAPTGPKINTDEPSVAGAHSQAALRAMQDKEESAKPSGRPGASNADGSVNAPVGGGSSNQALGNNRDSALTSDLTSKKPEKIVSAQDVPGEAGRDDTDTTPGREGETGRESRSSGDGQVVVRGEVVATDHGSVVVLPSGEQVVLSEDEAREFPVGSEVVMEFEDTEEQDSSPSAEDVVPALLVGVIAALLPALRRRESRASVGGVRAGAVMRTPVGVSAREMQDKLRAGGVQLLPAGRNHEATVRWPSGSEQTLWTINDPSAPHTRQFPLDIPEGGYATPNPDGSVTIYDANHNPVGGVEPPWSYDLLGRPQETWYEVQGDTLVQHVIPTENAVYPLFADPKDDIGVCETPYTGSSYGPPPANAKENFITLPQESVSQSPENSTFQDLGPQLHPQVEQELQEQASNNMAQTSVAPQTGVNAAELQPYDGDPTDLAIRMDSTSSTGSPGPDTIGGVSTAGHQPGDTWTQKVQIGVDENDNPVYVEREVQYTEFNTVIMNQTHPDGSTTETVVAYDPATESVQTWETHSQNGGVYSHAQGSTVTAEQFIHGENPGGRSVATGQSSDYGVSGDVQADNLDGTSSVGSYSQNDTTASNTPGLNATMTNTTSGVTTTYDRYTRPDGGLNTIIEVEGQDYKTLKTNTGGSETYSLNNELLVDGKVPDNPAERKWFDPDTGLTHNGWKGEDGLRHFVLEDQSILHESIGKNGESEWTREMPGGTRQKVTGFEWNPATQAPHNVQSRPYTYWEKFGREFSSIWNDSSTQEQATEATVQAYDGVTSTAAEVGTKTASTVTKAAIGLSRGTVLGIVGGAADWYFGEDAGTAAAGAAAGMAGGMAGSAATAAVLGLVLGPGVVVVGAVVGGAVAGYAATAAIKAWLKD